MPQGRCRAVEACGADIWAKMKAGRAKGSVAGVAVVFAKLDASLAGKAAGEFIVC